MPMSNGGYTKLIEECGELIQVAAKLIAFPDTEIHPDGSHQATRILEELADVQAVIVFLLVHDDRLDIEAFNHRTGSKLAIFEAWEKESG
jgi:NTP pyrophosphatase (non-canonical NTP hydrolase)